MNIALVLGALAVLHSGHIGSDDADPKDVCRSAVVYDGKLLCLGEKGAISSWDIKTSKYDKDTSTSLSRKDLTALASEGDKLWSVDGKSLYQWSASDKSWRKLATFESKEALYAIVPVGGSPYLVFPSKVIDPLGKQDFPVPKSDGLRREPPLRILVTYGTDSMLWIGTGYGEWGGALHGLDPKTAKWVKGNGHGYVTGITQSNRDEVIVSWSMSHFGASTGIQVHKADAAFKSGSSSLEGKYYQRIAYSSHDATLYGIESTDLVTIKDGKPTKVVNMDGPVVEREPMAIGGAPGVRALLPAGRKTVLIVPNRGDPTLVRDGEATRLKRP